MPSPKFRWNSTAGRYTNASGQFISRKAVHDAFNVAIDNSTKVIANATVAMKEGRTSVAAWQTLMRSEVKNVQLYTGALSKGGWAQLDPTDFGRIGQRIQTQYKALDRFAAEIASGKQKLDGTAVSRSRLYGQSGRQTLHLMERANNKELGYTKERSIKQTGNNCDDCLDEAARGWVDIGEIVTIGSRQCNMNCKCRIEYK